MEEVLCNKDGKVCMMKTGTKDGPNKGKSFYICISSGCGFTHNASVKPSHCINHADSMVELQAITHDLREQNHRLYYRCVVGKAAGQKWCGHVPWTPAEKENQNPLSSDRPLQPSFLPPVRNPFKAPDKTHRQDSEWKKMTAPGETEKKARDQTSERDRRTASQENGSKESNGTEDAHSRSVEDEDSGRSNSSDSYRGKHLPPGMKVKKRVSNEERSVSESDGEKNVVAEVKEKTRDGHRERSQEVKNSSTSSVNAPHADGACTIPPSPDGASTQQPTGAIKTTETSRKSQETSRKTKESASGSSPVGITQVGPKEETSLSSGKPTKPHATHSKEQDESRSDNASTPVVDDDDDDDDVLLVSVKPATGRTPPVTSVQKTLTAFSGFRQSSQVRGQQEDPRELHSLLSAQLKQKKATLSVVNVSALPDKGERLKIQVQDLEDALESLSITLPETSSGDGGGHHGGHHAKPAAAPCQSNPFSRQGGTVLLPCPPAPPGPLHLEASGGSSQGYSHYGAQSQEAAFYGGRMTDHRLLAVKNATSEAIDHLHKSMESCPGPDTEVPDPKGIKVTLLAHQRKALAWLLWRENQKPCGGILADDMGLGKTLTVIALILAQKKKTKEEDHKDNAEQLDSWISKNDSGLVVSKGTLIICPASLIHHWKNEIDRHVKTGKLSVYLYHGANRQRNARVLANHDVVVTTYSLVSKEIPVQKEDAERPSTDSDKVPSNSGALLRVAWARVVLDEAHNIKNPKVQQSQAACRLRAQARWAVTGTPIQNNLLDMYSLLKFLRCAPFDEYKLWKAQVDNGSKRGGERLNLLTKSLLLRRTKDQRDSAGNPLVYLPDRTCEVHRVKLSEDEMAVYNVVFAQSRSTLQNYLNRHEGNDVNTANTSTSNPFDKVAQEFGLSQSEAAVTPSSSQQKTTGVHILSLLLRLRQCCCHLSLLKKTLDQTELQGDGIILSLEEQLNALCLSSSSSPSPSAPDHQDTVSLNGSHFPSQLFESTSESTKISAVMTELKAIKQKGDDQKSVIVSQWTSMLRIVAVHLQKLGLSYAVIDGSVIPKKRMDLVDDFNTNPKGPQVMLVSLCAGGVGLNLIGGNHLFLVDMHWNPALEDQACDRIYRVGQRKDCTIHRFVCEGTVEDKISILQAKKKELAQKVLSGTGSSVTKLSLADLRVIFGI